MFALLWACTGDSPAPIDGFRFAEPDARPNAWAIGPSTTFSDAELWQNCATLTGGPEDSHHHNLVAPFRGALALPWAPEWGRGGLSLFDVSDPCAPTKLGEGFTERMRETHAIGLLHLPEGDAHAGDYAVVNGVTGIVFLEIVGGTPIFASEVELPDVFYPDAYARVPLSVFWQYPWVFVAVADNGVAVVDATDPYAPELVHQAALDPPVRAGGVFALGRVLLVTAAEQSQQAILDISDPTDPVPWPGGSFVLHDGAGDIVEPYHGNRVGLLALFARKSSGGGPILYNISDPSAPTFVGDFHDRSGNGGYLFMHEGFVFQGESHYGNVYDAREPGYISLLGTADLPGDLDTFVPFGNVGVLSVDDDYEDGVATAIVPWTPEPDDSAPMLLFTDPSDGDVGVPTGIRIGLGFAEFVEPSSVFAGSVRLWDEDGNAVDGWGSAQEATAHYTPKEPLRPETTYTLEVLAGGITDVNGNAKAETHSFSFTTGAE